MLNIVQHKFLKAVVAQWHKRVTVNATIASSIPSRGNELLIIYVFFISSDSKEKIMALQSATKYAMPRKFDGKWQTKCLKN